MSLKPGFLDGRGLKPNASRARCRLSFQRWRLVAHFGVYVAVRPVKSTRSSDRRGWPCDVRHKPRNTIGDLQAGLQLVANHEPVRPVAEEWAGQSAFKGRNHVLTMRNAQRSQPSLHDGHSKHLRLLCLNMASYLLKSLAARFPAVSGGCSHNSVRRLPRGGTWPSRHATQSQDSSFSHRPGPIYKCRGRTPDPDSWESLRVRFWKQYFFLCCTPHAPDGANLLEGTRHASPTIKEGAYATKMLQLWRALRPQD